MAKTKRIEGTSAAAAMMRRAASELPDVEEGVACEGTAVESRTFKVQGKAFLFLRPRTAMLKLGESAMEAAGMGEKEPGRYRVGAGGWATITLDDEWSPPPRVMARWIAESYEGCCGWRGEEGSGEDGEHGGGWDEDAARRRKPDEATRSHRSPKRAARAGKS